MVRGAGAASLAFAILSATVASAAENDVLYWMVDENATVDGASISSFFSSYDAPQDSTFAARVRVTGGNITEDTFLDLYYYDEELGNYSTYAGDLGVDFGDSGSGYWGAGVPDGNISPSGDYWAGSPEYSFIIELGNIANDEWTTVATSASETYSSLAETYMSQTFDINPPKAGIWTPTQFTSVVPEPSSGVLVAMGLSLLALRRRRKG